MILHGIMDCCRSPLFYQSGDFSPLSVSFWAQTCRQLQRWASPFLPSLSCFYPDAQGRKKDLKMLQFIRLRVILKLKANKLIVIKTSPPHLQVFAGLNLLADYKHFLFSVDPLGEDLILVFPLLGHFLPFKRGENKKTSEQ